MNTFANLIFAPGAHSAALAGAPRAGTAHPVHAAPVATARRRKARSGGWRRGHLLAGGLALGAGLSLAHAAGADPAVTFGVATNATVLPVPEAPLQPEATALVLELVAKFPRLTAACVVVGALRLPMKLLFTWLDHRAATDGENTAVDRIVASPAYGLLHLLTDALASVKLDRVLPGAEARAFSAVLVAGALALVFLPGCRLGPPDGRIIGVTQSVIGISIGQGSADTVPHVQLGYTRSQFHIVPTGTNIFAPAVLNSLSLDNTFSHQVIDEDFATGGATRDVKETSPATTSARGRATALTSSAKPAATAKSSAALPAGAPSPHPTLSPPSGSGEGKTNAPVVIPTTDDVRAGKPTSSPASSPAANPQPPAAPTDANPQ
jgi:hypothetical protein